MNDDGIKVQPFNTVVVDITTFEGVSKKTNKPFRKWSVITPDGSEWQTFDGQLAAVALSMKGRTALIGGTIKQNGSYTNYYLDSIEPGTTEVTVQAATTAVEAPQAVGATDVTFAEFVNHHDAAEARKNESIHRQVAAKVSGHISETAADFWANVTDLFAYFQTGALPSAHATMVTPTVAVSTPVTSHATVDPQVTDVTYSHGDNDIPF